MSSLDITSEAAVIFVGLNPVLIQLQPQRIGAARVRLPHGAQAAEGVYDCMFLVTLLIAILEFLSTNPTTAILSPTRLSLDLTSLSTDVLQDGPAVLRRLCQRLHHQVSHQPGRAMCHALCGQAPEGFCPAAGALPGAECCYDAERPDARSVNNSTMCHIRDPENSLMWRKGQCLRHRMARAACSTDPTGASSRLAGFQWVTILPLRTNERKQG